MQLPSRRTRIALLAGCATFAAAAPASAAVTSTYSTNPDATLTVNSDGADAITITCDNGLTKVNGLDPVRDPVENPPKATTGCAGPHAIVVNGGPGDNAINLAGVTKALFTSLTDTPAVVTVNGGEGIDTVTGTEFSDVVNGGGGDDRLVAAKGALDTMNGDGGDDTLVWNNGEGTDNMNGGDGTDTIENNGSDSGATANEVYTAETIPGGYKFSRTSAGPFDLFVSNSERYVNNMFGGDDAFSQNNAVGGIAITLNAGAGTDNLGGTDGNDVVNGEAGNDTLAPGKGNDTMNGGDNDDLMIWKPGEGSDVMEGGPGNDTAQDNGGAVPEHFIVSPNGARVTATRDTQAPFFLDIGTTELLDLNTLGGADTVDVNKGLGAMIKVDADLGEGDDIIHARNDSAQNINGGAGTDSARIDKTDTITAVEKISGLDRKAPKIKLAAKRLKLKKGTVAFTVKCPSGEQFCKGTVKVFNAKNKLVGSKKVLVKGGKSKKVTIKLKKAAVAKIKAQGKVKYKVRFSAKDAAGNASALQKKFTIRA